MIKEYYQRYKGEIVYLFSSVVAPVISILGSIVASIFINPTDMGIICNCLLIGTYASFLQLGVFNGLNRNIAYYKAQKKEIIMQQMVNTSHTVALLVSIIGLIIGIIYGLFVVNKGHVYILGALLLIVNLVFTPLSTHYETTYRSGQEFKRLGIIKFKESLVYSFIVFLPALLGFLGKIISDSFKLILSFILRLKDLPIKSTGYGNIVAYKNLVKTGFPMLLSGYIWSIFQVADQTYISTNFGEEQLGLYTLSRYCVMAFVILPQAINSVLYPKAASCYGSSGDKSVLLGFWRRSLFLYTIIIVPIVAILYYVAPILIPYIMPKYVGGIECMKINLISCATYIYMGPSVVFGTLRKNKLYIGLIALCLILFWMFATIINGFSSPVDVAYFKLLLSCILSVSSIALSYYYIRTK